jgi:signal transduction histidine kinase
MLEGIHDLLLAADLGYELEVLMAGDGQIGLERMAERTPDLIVTDIMMPRMDGFQFLQRVRKNPAWIRIPIIFLTAKGEKSEIREGRLSGVNLYVVKPFESDQLLELIESQLTRAFRLQLAHQQSVENFKKNILQVLNHEFRTPLTYVTAYYEMLADSLGSVAGPQDFQEYLRGIQAGSLRLTGLVEDLIQVMELRTGEAEAVFRGVARPIDDLGALLADVVASAQGSAERHGVQIHYSRTSRLPDIFGHEAGLRNAFGRLLNNAVKFTRSRNDASRNVYVSSEIQGNEVHLHFEDEGVGFPDKIRGSIFDLFFQYNRGLMEQQGAGVGLTIAKGWIDLHRGRILATSREDVGSKFTVVLPIHTGDLPAGPGSAETRKQATILIVEDDLHLLRGLQELLEIGAGRYEYRTLVATNGESGLEALAVNQPDLIISDIMMPHMDGYEFLKRVRRHPEWLHIPFIFLSAKGEPHEIHTGLRSGAEEYITKPYDSDELLELVGKQLDRHFAVQGVLTQSFEALKRSILDLITPDFRLPLASVSRFSEELAEGFRQAQTDEEFKDSLEGIKKSSMRLTRLVEDFISLAELKTGEAAAAHELRAQPIGDLGLLFCEAGRMATQKAQLKHLRLHCSTDTKLPPIFGNSATLYDSVQRLMEAVVGHLKLTCTAVHLSTSFLAGEAHLTIRFPEDPDKEKLAEVKEILSSDAVEFLESSRHLPGFSIARGFVELHGGRIGVSVGEEGSCVFEIILPAYSATKFI